MEVRRRSVLGRSKKNLNFISKESSSTIKQFDIEEKGSEVKERFWNGVDSLYFTKFHKQHESFSKQQIERLCSYKKAEGWFTLNKGATTVIVGNRATFSKVFGEFHKWKESARLKSFEVAFKEYHDEKIVADRYSLVAVDSSIIRKQTGCCIIFEAPIGGGKLPPEAIKCPVCGQIMEIVSYKYGHNSKG